MRILVTGGAGFIGSNLVKRLLVSGHDVSVIDDLSSGFRSNLDGIGDIKFIEGSILEPSRLAHATEGCEAIVHLAAIPSVAGSVAQPEPTHDVNATGTLEVLEIARQRGAYVVTASSSAVYGENSVLPKVETMAQQPRSPYAVSKLAAESYTIAWHSTYGLPTLAFRFFNVYGPLQPTGHAYAAVVPAFVSAAVAGKPVTIHGDGTQTRDFTYVDSVTAILEQAAIRQVTYPLPVNLAFGSRYNLLDVVEELELVLGTEVEREFAPPRPGDVKDSQADNTLLTSLFPDAKATPFSEGLATTVEWMRTVI